MPKSSRLVDGAKICYRPIEAAIRWSGLLRFERRILATLGRRPLPEATEFPRWPMLRLNTERIFDALAHGEMPYGKEGLVRDTQGLAMDDPSLTVRHVDLKAWMAHYYPGEKPAFLFDEVERALHLAFAPYRVNPRREFFKIEANQAIAILKLLHTEDATEEVAEEVAAEVNAGSSETQKDVEVGTRAGEQYRQRRPNMNFREMNIPVGSILTSTATEQEVAVTGDKKVKLGDEEMFLTPATKRVLNLIIALPPALIGRIKVVYSRIFMMKPIPRASSIG